MSEPVGATVLDRLDQRTPTRFYWSLTILATIGGFLFGYDTSNIGAALNFVPFHLSGFALGYLVAGTSIGAAAGALAAGPLTDRFGRKSLLIVDAGIYAAGSLLAGLSWHAWVLIIARTLIGLAIGADSAIATAYIAEYAPAGKRGSLSLLQQWMITIGILVSYLVALVILRIAPGAATTIDWRLMFALGALPAIVGLIFRTRMPESPRWLLHHGKFDKARQSLGMLGVDTTDEQIKAAARDVAERERQEKVQRRRKWTPAVRRAVIIVAVFFVFQQITGINVPLYYGPTLLAPILGGAHSTVAQQIQAVEITSIMTVINVGATYFGFKYIDKLGRRKMSIGGYGGMIVSALIAAAGLGLLHGTAEIVVGMIGLCLFIASFAVGVGGTGWLLQGESFPTEVRGRAAAICAMADWLANFALIQVFPVWQAGIGLPWVLVCFAGLAAMAIVFISIFLPETKGLPVEEVVRRYERHAAPGAAEMTN